METTVAVIPARVLVTGSSGFLGAAVVEKLLARPDVERVVGVDLRPAERRDPRHVVVRRNIVAGVGDLLTEHRVDAVVHHAFVIRPPRDPAAARRVNVTATARLAEEASAAGVGHIVYPSSATVYGAWPGTGPHTEDESPHPIPGFTYSEDKVAAEQALAAAEAAGGPSVTLVRACVVAGPGATGFILASLALPLLPVPANTDPDLQFLHIDDYTGVIETALATPVPGTYNLAGEGTVRVREMARLVGSRVVGVPEPLLRGLIRWSWRLRLQSRSPESGLAFISHPWLVSTEAATASFGWRPRHSSVDAIRSWADWRRGRR